MGEPRAEAALELMAEPPKASGGDGVLADDAGYVC